MEPKELAEYLDEKLAEMHPNFQWKIVKNNAQGIVELFVCFKIDVPETIQVQDSEGRVNEPGILQFEDTICFYDPAVSHVSPDHYLKSFIFDFDTGIEQGLVDVILKHLNIVVTQGSAELREFVQQTQLDQFELSWNDSNFQGTIQTFKEIDRYRYDRLHMDVKKDQSFIEQLKGISQDDKVERN